MVTVRAFDEMTSGERSAGLDLEFLTERVTVRELIRSRVYQEVTEHNARKTLDLGHSFQPTGDELALNGDRQVARGRADWERQFELALRAFEGNGFLLFAGDTQLLDLEEEVELTHDTEITFLRLVPLVGG